MIFALDLEGVLAPEIWPVLGNHFDAPELSFTTRDVADFTELMQKRIDATRERGITLERLQRVAHGVQPFLGSHEFLARLRKHGQVVIISDTFHEFAEPLIEQLGGHSLFANRFVLNGDGLISGFQLRIRGQKERIVSGFKSAGFNVAAMGDSLNDVSLLETCDYPAIYRPVESLREKFPDAPMAQNLDEALEILLEYARQDEALA